MSMLHFNSQSIRDIRSVAYNQENASSYDSTTSYNCNTFSNLSSNESEVENFELDEGCAESSPKNPYLAKQVSIVSGEIILPSGKKISIQSEKKGRIRRIFETIHNIFKGPLFERFVQEDGEVIRQEGLGSRIYNIFFKNSKSEEHSEEHRKWNAPSAVKERRNHFLNRTCEERSQVKPTSRTTKREAYERGGLLWNEQAKRYIDLPKGTPVRSAYI